MTHIRPDETELQGFWIDLGSSMTPDANWERIEKLTSDYLEHLAMTSDGRERLYRDPADGRLWERIPVAHNLPAGPPLLQVISPSRAQEKYSVTIA
ncbi:MAG: hypothetical protein HXX11_15845 [Desulfuromonadales bacterium]|nr:hypothetical protein [Desulfuromonadales bacterium]